MDRGKRNHWKIIFLPVCAVLLAACGRPAVDYKDAGGSKTEQEGIEKEGADSKDLQDGKDAETEKPVGILAEELGVEGMWQAEWAIPRDSGGSKRITVNAAVEIPDTDAMYVSRVTQRYFQTEEKKKIAEDLFDEGSIISIGNGGYATREELAEAVKAQEEWIRDSEGTADENDYARLEKDRKLYENFKELEKGDYSVNLYKGTVNGLPYTLSFGTECTTTMVDETDNTQEVVMFISEINLYAEQGAAFYERDNPIVYGLNDSVADFGQNKAQKTASQAKEEALRYCEAWGIQDMDVMECHELNWAECLEKEDEDGDNKQEYLPIEKNGYILYLCRKINGGFVSESPVGVGQGSYVGMDESWGEGFDEHNIVEVGQSSYFEPDWVSGDEEMIMYITDAGIIGLEYLSPLQVEEVMSKCTELLSFDNVKTVMEEQIFKRFKNYGGGAVCLDHMRLTYMCVGQKDAEGKLQYYLLPVWQLYRMDVPWSSAYWEKDYSTDDMVINAIDGTLIYNME